MKRSLRLERASDAPDDLDLFRTRLDTLGGTLPPAGRRVADYIDAHRVAVLASSAAELAERSGTSDATVIRTVQALGFAGLGALKQALVVSAAQPPSLADDMRRTLRDAGADTERAVNLVLDAHEEAMEHLRQPASRAAIVAAVAVLNSAARIGLFGIGPSAALANYALSQLTRAGRSCFTLTVTGSMLADQLLQLQPNDALLVMAYGRAYPEAVTVFAEARRLHLPIVLVTDKLSHKLVRHAAVVLPAARGRAQRVALHGATLVCLEALILGLTASGGTRAIATLDRLNRLREAIRGPA